MNTLSAILGGLARYPFLRHSQFWSPGTLQDYTHLRLKETLQAAARIPFYSRLFERIPKPQDLGILPILRRDQIRELNQSVRNLCQPHSTFDRSSSSGSTGMPVEFLHDTSHQRGRLAARIRYLRQNGWNPRRRNAWIIYMPVESHRTAMRRSGLDQFMIRTGSFLGEKSLSIFTDHREQVTWLERINPDTLYTMPSNLEILLDLFESGRERLPALKRILCGGEMIESALCERARRVLGVRVAGNYGSGEAFLAWECPKGSYHINAEHVHIEIVDTKGRSVSPGDTGRVLVTTLENRLMPLVRYEIGDLATRATAGHCPCGRTLPLLGKILGRSINMFWINPEKALSPWRLVSILKIFPRVRQFQVVQQAFGEFTLRYISSSPLVQKEVDDIKRCFWDCLNDRVQVEFERVPVIPRAPTGKFMTAISEVVRPHP